VCRFCLCYCVFTLLVFSFGESDSPVPFLLLIFRSPVLLLACCVTTGRALLFPSPAAHALPRFGPSPARCLPLVSCGFSVDSFFFVTAFGDRISDPLFPARVCILVRDLLPCSASVEIISAPRFSSPAQGVRRSVFWFPPRSAGPARQFSSRGLRCSALSACSCVSR
jgi:hypothetical protein